jgi:hypothetical protein
VHACLNDRVTQLQLLKRALLIQETVFGPGHEEVRLTLEELAEAYGRCELLAFRFAVTHLIVFQFRRCGGAAEVQTARRSDFSQPVSHLFFINELQIAIKTQNAASRCVLIVYSPCILYIMCHTQSTWQRHWAQLWDGTKEQRLCCQPRTETHFSPSNFQ